MHDVDVVHQDAVSFASGEGITLSGTLFIPDAGRRHPAIVLFHGSGPESRNREMGYWFAKHGVAALTYDKRGVGESTGNFRTVPFTTLCEDGLAAVAFLKRRADIDASRIGVWGLSQGGWLGPLAASQSSDVRFVIAVSGPAVTPGEQMIFYYANQLRHQGLAEAEIAEASTLRRLVWTCLSRNASCEESRAALDRSAPKRWFAMLQAQADGGVVRGMLRFETMRSS